jgi:hypothetical protein
MEQLAAFTTVINPSVLNGDDKHLQKKLDRNFVNLESHQLVWLGSQHGHNSVSIETLREIIDYTKLFENTQACEEYIKSSNDTTTFLMISDEINQEIIPRVHNLDQVLGIYIHSTSSEQNNKESVSMYSKVSTQISPYDVCIWTVNGQLRTIYVTLFYWLKYECEILLMIGSCSFFSCTFNTQIGSLSL